MFLISSQLPSATESKAIDITEDISRVRPEPRRGIPDKTHNLIHDPGHGEVLESLREDLQRLVLQAQGLVG